MPKKQDWTPRSQATAKALAPELTEILRSGIASQRELFEYTGPAETFWETVTQDDWDHEMFREVGWYSGILSTALDLAKEFGVVLSDKLVEDANFHIYQG